MSRIFKFILLLSLFINNLIALDILNNGKLKFGSGTINSINTTTGLLEQPLYYDSNTSTWYKLTYSSYGLNFGIGIGSTHVFSGTGSGSTTPTNVSILPNITSGYGSVTSTAIYSVNGNNIEVNNTYVLDYNKSFIKITTDITNISGSSISDVNVWVGTKDDYVGLDDTPTKTKGNIVNGSFVANTNMTDQAKTLKIESNSGSPAVGSVVLFYSTNDNIDMINPIADLDFINVMNTDPNSTNVTNMSDDPYGMKVTIGTLANNETSTFDWYYAAGKVEDIANIIPPPVNNPPVISGTPDATVQENNAYSFTPTFSDADINDTLTLSITNKPSWATFNTATGLLTGTPTKGDIGTTYTITISITDGSDTAILAPFNIKVVRDPNQGIILDIINDIDPTNFLGTNKSTDEIVTTLYFSAPPAVATHGVDVEWGTDANYNTLPGDSTYLQIESNNTATVNRSTNEDIIIRLNAKVTKDSFTARKSFVLTILKEENNATLNINRNYDALDWFRIRNANFSQFDVTSNLILPTIGTDDVNISWSSDLPTVIQPTNDFNISITNQIGVVSADTRNQLVTLTATLTKPTGTTRTKTFKLLVPQSLSNNCNAILTKAKSQLTIEKLLGNKNRSADSIVDFLTLGTPTTFNLEDKENLTLEYSSNSIYLVVNGTAGESVRANSGDRKVKLTAKLSKSSCPFPVYKIFDFTVKAMDGNISKVIINDINNSISTNAQMLINFNVETGENYDYVDENGSNLFIAEDINTTIVSTGLARESTQTNPSGTNITNVLTKLYTNGVIENISDVKDDVDMYNQDIIKQNFLRSEILGSTIQRYDSGVVDINSTIDNKKTILSSDINGTLSHTLKTLSGTGETKAISYIKGSKVELTDAYVLRTSAPARQSSNGNEDYELKIETLSSGVSTSTFKTINNTSSISEQSILITTQDENASSTIGKDGDITVISKDNNGTKAVVYTDTEGKTTSKFIINGSERLTSKTNLPYEATSSHDVNITIKTINGKLQIHTFTPLIKPLQF